MRGVGRNTAQQIRRGRCGNREGAVRAVHHAPTHIEGGAIPGTDLQGMHTRGGGDNVDDGVHGADFVKVDLLHGHVVNLGFGVPEQLKRLNC